MIELNKNYFFNEIEEFANNNNYELEAFGYEIIGEHFILLKHNDKDITHSFILDGATSSQYIYKCVYSD